MDKVITDELLPPEISRSGKNTCYLHCSHLNRRPNYGVCLFTIQAYDEDRLDEDNDCYRIIASGECRAMAYQAEEHEAGRALYYLPRDIPVAPPSSWSGETKLTELARSRAERREAAMKPKPRRRPKPKPKSAVFGTETATLADAVSTAAKEHATKRHKDEDSKATGKAVKERSAKAGLSLLERAKQMVKDKHKEARS